MLSRAERFNSLEALYKWHTFYLLPLLLHDSARWNVCDLRSLLNLLAVANLVLVST